MKNLIIFYPSYERGGATKILINLIKVLSKKNIKIYLIINNFIYKHKNLEVVKVNNKYNFFKTRFFSSLLGSVELIRLINKLNKSETRILSMQSNFFSVLICFFKRIKVIVRVSEDPCGATKYADEKIFSYLVLLSKFLTYNMATSIIVNAKKSFLCVKKFLYNKKKIRILYNPSLNKINKFKIKNNNRTFLSIGRFCKQKNQILLVKAFTNFCKKNKNYRLILCGDGPDKNDLYSFIKNQNLTKKIILKKWNSNLDKYYKDSSVFILTSLYEGMPNVLIEAINNNIPCIATNVSGVPDLLLNGKGGIILKNFNTFELQNKLNNIAKNYSEFAKKAKIAKNYLYRYELNKASGKYINFLMKV